MSMQEYVCTGHVHEGTLKIANRAKLIKTMRRWHDGEVVITIERVHATRSLEQNAAYWVAYIKPLADHTGYDPRWIHAYLKKRFLPAKHLVIQDRAGTVVTEEDVAALTTTTLNRNEFSEYLQAIEGWAAELGVNVGTNCEAA